MGSAPVNCLECGAGKIITQGFVTDWGLYCGNDPELVMRVKGLASHDGRIIAPTWCPKRTTSEAEE